MANVSHASLTGTNLHESKGVATAAAGAVYIADGAGSGVWTVLPGASTSSALIGFGQVSGLNFAPEIANPTIGITIQPGTAVDVTGVSQMRLQTAITKRVNAVWVVGNNQGGIDTGSLTDGWWYLFLIMRTDTGVVDVIFSQDQTTPTLPLNYNRKRRVGALHVTSGLIDHFTQVGSNFWFKTPIQDYQAGITGSVRNLISVTVPTGFIGLFRVSYFAIGNSALVLQPTYETDAQPDFGNSPGTSLYTEVSNQGASGDFTILVDNSSLIAARSDISGTLQVITRGWQDSRN